MPSTRVPPSDRGTKHLNTQLWIAQGLLAVVFLFAGAMKFVMPPDQMTAESHMSIEFLRFIGLCEIVGALGLILPGLLHVRPLLTPIAAACLAIIMIGATVVTATQQGVAPALMPLIVLILTAFVAYGRWKRAPLRGVALPGVAVGR